MEPCWGTLPSGMTSGAQPNSVDPFTPVQPQVLSYPGLQNSLSDQCAFQSSLEDKILASPTTWIRVQQACLSHGYLLYYTYGYRRTDIHAHKHACMHTYIHPYILHECMHDCMHTCEDKHKHITLHCIAMHCIALHHIASHCIAYIDV